VDFDNSRKKDMKLPSTKLAIYVGSLRVMGLGYIVPLSVHGSSSNLVPVGYASQRIYWSTKAEGCLQLYSTKSSLDTEGDFRPYFDNLKDAENQEPFCITINHSKRKDYKRSRRAHDEFIKWMEIAPVYIDEYENSWEMPCLPIVMQSYITGTGLMQNGLKKFFEEKVIVLFV